MLLSRQCHKTASICLAVLTAGVFKLCRQADAVPPQQHPGAPARWLPR
jgi:hypothetical protein